MEAASSKEARRKEVLPVPPVRRIVMLLKVLEFVWWKVMVKDEVVAGLY